MTRLRARIAERLVDAQQTAAILTTFNEINMNLSLSCAPGTRRVSRRPTVPGSVHVIFLKQRRSR